MALRIVALAIGVIIATGVVAVALEARYQSCVTEAEARNPVYVTVEQGEGELIAPWRQNGSRTPGRVESSVEGLSERRQAVDDC